MIDPVLGVVVLLVCVAFAYWYGNRMGRLDGEQAEWLRSDETMKSVAKTWSDKYDALVAQCACELKAGEALTAKHATQQRRLRGVLSEARRWKALYKEEVAAYATLSAYRRADIAHNRRKEVSVPEATSVRVDP